MTPSKIINTRKPTVEDGDLPYGEVLRRMADLSWTVSPWTEVAEGEAWAHTPDWSPPTGDTAMTLAPFQQRVIDEKAALDEKFAKLQAFIETDTFEKLSRREMALLVRQGEAMCVYSWILGQRISLFTENG